MLIIDDSRADDLLKSQVMRDTTVDGRRRTFVAGAGRKSAQVKSEYFRRFFADRTLNDANAVALPPVRMRESPSQSPCY